MLPGLYEDRRYSAHFSFFPPIRGVSVRSSRLKIRQRSLRILIPFVSVENWRKWVYESWCVYPFSDLNFWWNDTGSCEANEMVNEKKENLSYFSSVYIIIFRILEYFFFFFSFDTLCLSRIYYLLIRLHLLAKILTVSNIR